MYPGEGRGPVVEKNSRRWRLLGPGLRRGTGKLSRLFHLHQMLNLADLAHDLGRSLDLHRAAELVEAEPDERRPLRLVAADRRSGLGDLDFRHHNYSTTASACASASAVLAPPRPSRSATFLP